VAAELASIAIGELLRGGIWEFNSDESSHDETWVYPVVPLPASTLAGRVAATNVALADGTRLPAMIGNIDVRDPRRTKLFLGVRLLLPSGQWFHLARHFDVDYDTNGPQAFAAALGMPLDRVFPIHYDLSDILMGDPASVVGQLPAVPSERITSAEAIRLAVEGTSL
jgi:hypothetical protein